MWLLFGVVQSIGLAFEGLPWAVTGIVAFAAYKLAATVGFPFLAAVSPDASPRMLLLLRVFALGKRSEQLLRALRKLWLRSGTIALIAGPDLVASSLPPTRVACMSWASSSRPSISRGSYSRWTAPPIGRSWRRRCGGHPRT
jgi:hypothetical protein